MLLNYALFVGQFGFENLIILGSLKIFAPLPGHEIGGLVPLLYLGHEIVGTFE